MFSKNSEILKVLLNNNLVFPYPILQCKTYNSIKLNYNSNNRGINKEKAVNYSQQPQVKFYHYVIPHVPLHAKFHLHRILLCATLKKMALAFSFFLCFQTVPISDSNTSSFCILLSWLSFWLLQLSFCV